MNSRFKNKNGFTLIEMIIVMAVFLFIVGAAIGIFISIIQNQKKVLAEQQFLNQISYAEEYMSKALRMASVAEDDSCIPKGDIYSLTRYDTSLAQYRGIKFINQSDNGGTCQEFFLDNFTSNGTNQLTLNDLNNPLVLKDIKGVALTSSDMQIKSVKFALNGDVNKCAGETTCDLQSNTSDNPSPIQPRVTILLKVAISGDSQGAGDSCTNDEFCSVSGKVCDLSTNKCVTPRIIQTTISQRNLNAQNQQ